MTALNKLASLNDAIAHAKRLADQGYGWCDIVVRCDHRLSVATAKQIVLEAEYARLARSQEAKP